MGDQRLKEKRDESVRRILDAAMEVFAEVGYERHVDEMQRGMDQQGQNQYRIGTKRNLMRI
jgi:hypothetical protein